MCVRALSWCPSAKETAVKENTFQSQLPKRKFCSKFNYFILKTNQSGYAISTTLSNTVLLKTIQFNSKKNLQNLQIGHPELLPRLPRDGLIRMGYHARLLGVLLLFDYDCAETATLFWFLASKRRANSKASFWFTPLMEVDLNATSPGQSVKSVFNLSS